MSKANLPETGINLKDRMVLLDDGSEVELSSLCGKKGLVLFLYPKDSTPGCTTEACSFRDSYSELRSAGFEVIGLSPDPIASHQKFRQRQSLPFALISDPEHLWIDELGAWVEKSMCGKKYMGVARSTLILDSKLRILLRYDKVKPKEHVAQIVADLAELA